MKKSLFLILQLLIFLNIYAQSIDYDLINAVYNNNEKAIFDLLRKGANPNATTSSGITPLMYAVQNGNYFICKKLISSGADVNNTNKNLVPPLNNAIMNSDTGIVLLLLENGANPNTIDYVNYQTPLILSIEKNNI